METYRGAGFLIYRKVRFPALLIFYGKLNQFRRKKMSQYNHTAIEKKWRSNWEKNPINVNDGKNTIVLICSLIRREADFMWDTGEDTSSQTYGAVTSY